MLFNSLFALALSSVFFQSIFSEIEIFSKLNKSKLPARTLACTRQLESILYVKELVASDYLNTLGNQLNMIAGQILQGLSIHDYSYLKTFSVTYQVGVLITNAFQSPFHAAGYSIRSNILGQISASIDPIFGFGLSKLAVAENVIFYDPHTDTYNYLFKYVTDYGSILIFTILLPNSGAVFLPYCK